MQQLRIRLFSTKFLSPLLLANRGGRTLLVRTKDRAMRGDMLPLPPISTYAFDRPGAEARTSTVVRPVIAKWGTPLITLGGVSALVAISFALKEGGAEPGERELRSGSPSFEAEPGFSFERQRSQHSDSRAPDGASAPLDDQTAHDLDNLPSLGVLQARAQLRADAQAPSQIRPESGEVRFKLVRIQDPPVRTVARCERDCAEERTAAPSDTAFVDAVVGGVEATGSSAAMPGRELKMASTVEVGGAAMSASVIKADIASELLVDAEPSVLLVQPATLVAQQASVASVLTTESHAALSDVQRDVAPVPVSALEDGPQISSVEPAEGAGEQNRLAVHIARIGERYPPVSPSEAVVKVIKTPSEAEGDLSSQVLQRPLGATPDRPTLSSARLMIPETSASSAIIVDDELVAIRLDDLVSLLESSFDRRFYVWLRSSAAASKFVTSETLAAAGIQTSYDPVRRQLVFAAVDE